MKDLLARFKTRANAMLAACVFALMPAFAFAQSTGDFDPAPIISKIVSYGGMAVMIIGALLLAKWALRALGILK